MSWVLPRLPRSLPEPVPKAHQQNARSPGEREVERGPEHRLLGERTGVPIVLNTSFNENEPIVMTPEHAVETFAKTKMDLLVLGNHVVRRG